VHVHRGDGGQREGRRRGGLEAFQPQRRGRRR
jgi:hypothetical protein